MINNVEEIVVFIDLKVFNSENFCIFPTVEMHFCRETTIKDDQLSKL